MIVAARAGDFDVAWRNLRKLTGGPHDRSHSRERRSPVTQGKIIAPRALDPRLIVDVITGVIQGRGLVLAAPDLWVAAGDEPEAQCQRELAERLGALD